MGCAQDAVLKFYFWADVLSTQSTRDPEVVNGIRESMVPRVLLEAAGVRSNLRLQSISKRDKRGI